MQKFQINDENTILLFGYESIASHLNIQQA
jgi:hypothetical protein